MFLLFTSSAIPTSLNIPGYKIVGHQRLIHSLRVKPVVAVVIHFHNLLPLLVPLAKASYS